MFMKILLFFALVVSCLLTADVSMAQVLPKDSSQPRIIGGEVFVSKEISVKDSLRRAHGPRNAAIRSAILPGLGQIYNKKYWKAPIVWGVLGITGGIFSYNLTEYRKVRFAYFALLNADTPSYAKVAPELQPFIANNDINSLRNYRNEFRKNIDYTVLYFMLFWGLNVIDATVDAHLKGFDVSRELSLKIEPSLNTIPNGAGLSLVLSFKKPVSKWAYTTPAP
jgi:hypothetical protein